MADAQQKTDWSAIRLMALQCLSAAWHLVQWAERSHESDYDVESAARHVAAIDEAHDTLYHAIRKFSPGVRLMGRDFLCASAHFDAIARASVGEGPRPDFRVGGTCCATAHQSAYVLLRIAIGQFESALMDDGIAAHFDCLRTPSPKTMRDWRILRTLSPEALRDTLVHLEKVAQLTGLFAGQSADVLRAWIDREWAAVEAGGKEIKQERYLDIALGDREAFRIVDGREYGIEFDAKGKPWDLFKVLIGAGENGIHRRDLVDQIGASLDKHKATLLGLIEPLELDIDLTNGIWTLTSM